MIALLAETGDRLVQQTGFAVVIDSVTVRAPWTALADGAAEPWQAHDPSTPTTWTPISRAALVWIETTRG